jgi:hypothetical protein
MRNMNDGNKKMAERVWPVPPKKGNNGSLHLGDAGDGLLVDLL